MFLKKSYGILQYGPDETLKGTSAIKKKEALFSAPTNLSYIGILQISSKIVR